MNIQEKLRAIQMKLKAPKNQFNSFGNYNYRNCEDILEAVKPLCDEQGLTLTISDTLVAVGNRIYVVAKARISADSENFIETTACAREAETQKGMNDAQITGSSSSYARKYALNGLFCIDDTKDPDTDEHKNQADNAPKVNYTTSEDVI